MEQNNENKTTLTLESKINTLPDWNECKTRLIKWVDELGEKSISEGFDGGRTAPFAYQVLATLKHGSAGAVRESWVRYELGAHKEGKEASIVEFLTNNLVALTKEEQKEREERAKHEAALTAEAQTYETMFAKFVKRDPLTQDIEADTDLLADDKAEVRALLLKRAEEREKALDAEIAGQG